MDTDTNDSMACHTPIVMDSELGRPHFAHISIDIEGSLHLQCSRSIANTFQGSLSVRLADTFLEAVAMSEEACFPIGQGGFHIGRIESPIKMTDFSSLRRPSITSPNHGSN